MFHKSIVRRSVFASIALMVICGTGHRAQAAVTSPINILTYTDPAHGFNKPAQGDCKTDDSGVINDAIAALENLTGWPTHTGLVYFPTPPGGCYLVNSPIVLSGDPSAKTSITLEGDGPGVSVIRAGAAMTSTGLDAVLVKDNAWDVGHNIKDITFDANGLANHAIHVIKGCQMHFTRVQGFNGLLDDLRLDGWGQNFVSESYFTNNLSAPYLIPKYNIYISGPSTGGSAQYNVFTNNIMTYATIAGIYDTGWNDLFFGNHPYSVTDYDFVAGPGSTWVGNEADGSAQAAFVVTGWGVNISSNLISFAQNHGVCILPNIANISVFGNEMTFSQIVNGQNQGTNPPPANAVVLAPNANVNSDTSYNCGTTAVPTAVWGTAANNYQNNLIFNNLPTSNENLWSIVYPSSSSDNAPTPSMVGIGTTAPQSQLDVNGETRVGNSYAACSSQNAGAIRFDSSTNSLLGCNGSAWKAFGWAQPAAAAVQSSKRLSS